MINLPDDLTSSLDQLGLFQLIPEHLLVLIISEDFSSICSPGHILDLEPDPPQLDHREALQLKFISHKIGLGGQLVVVLV